jgi:hypothetical protein
MSITTAARNNSLESRLTRALPGPEAVRRQQQQANINLIFWCSAATGLSLLSGLVVAVIVGKNPLPDRPTDPVDQAKIELWQKRDQYIEKLYRSDRSPNNFSSSETGWIQQTIANQAGEALDKAMEMRNNPNHPAYRQPSEIALAFQEVDANEILLLASMGAGNPQLTYYRPNGKKVVEPLSPSAFTYIGLGKLAANDLAQNLQVRYNFSIEEILAEIGPLQQQSRMAKAAVLEAQQLPDAAAELQKIQIFREQK